MAHRQLTKDAIAQVLAGTLPSDESPGRLVRLQYAEWPVWAKAIARFRRPEDRGVGDTIARVVGPIGGEAYKAWYQRVTGKPCGCDARQQRLNEAYSYAASAGLLGGVGVRSRKETGRPRPPVRTGNRNGGRSPGR